MKNKASAMPKLVKMITQYDALQMIGTPSGKACQDWFPVVRDIDRGITVEWHKEIGAFIASVAVNEPDGKFLYVAECDTFDPSTGKPGLKPFARPCDFKKDIMLCWTSLSAVLEAIGTPKAPTFEVSAQEDGDIVQLFRDHRAEYGNHVSGYGECFIVIKNTRGIYAAKVPTFSDITDEIIVKPSEFQRATEADVDAIKLLSNISKEAFKGPLSKSASDAIASCEKTIYDDMPNLFQ